MSWGGVGREREEEPAPPTSAFRWVAVGALCLAVVLFAVAFVVIERRATSSSVAASVSSPVARTPTPSSDPPTSDPPTASEPSSPAPSSATQTGGAPADRELFDFSGGGTEGWDFGAWQEGGPRGQVAPAPPPARGVTVVSPAGSGWFRAPFGPPVDLTGATTLSYDVDGGGTDVIVAMSVGPQAAWCETKGDPAPPGASTVTVELASILQGCQEKGVEPKDLSDVRSLQIWFSPGTFMLGSVRVGG